jgi:ABC-type amino acid transport substrate-binding protein
MGERRRTRALGPRGVCARWLCCLLQILVSGSILSASVQMVNGQTEDAVGGPITADVTTNANSTSTNSTANNNKFIVCTISLEPMAYCDVGSNASTSFTGLSIETFRDVALDAKGWKEGEDYMFVCVDTDTPTTLKERIVPKDGDCDAFIASTTISAERTEMGVVWAFPYWSGSIGIITKSTPQTSSGWAWTKPFTWKLWLAIGVTVILLPIIIYLLEVLSIKKSLTLHDSVNGYVEATWRTLWVIIQGETMSVGMLAARVVVIVLAFMALILSASYTANLAAFLTLQSFSSLNNIYDLQGLAVSTVEVYRPKIQARYGIKTSEAMISSADDLLNEAALVADGVLAAFLIDAEVAQYIVATWPECKLRLLPNTIEPFKYGLAFNTRVEQELVDQFSLSIIRLSEDGTLASIGDRFLLADSPCLANGFSDDEIGKIGFKQVYGLWVLVAGGVVIGLMIMIAVRIYKRRTGAWSSPGGKRQLQTSESHLAHNFERGDSREVGKEDLLRSQSDLHSL